MPDAIIKHVKGKARKVVLWEHGMMKKRKEQFGGQIRSRFQAKVLLSILLPVVVFCVITNIVISALLGYQLMEKRREIEMGYLSVIYSYLEDTKANLDVLALTAESSFTVQRIMQKNDLDSVEAKSDALDAQELLSAYLSSSNISDYVEEMIVLNRSGVRISATSTQEMLGSEQILASSMFTKNFGGRERTGVAESVIDAGEIRLVYAYPLDMAERSYIYIELNTDLIDDMLEPYEKSANIIVEREGEDSQAWYSSDSARRMYEERAAGGRYEVNSMTYDPFGLSLSVLSEKSLYSGDMASVMYILLVTVILVICIGISVSRKISSRITGPLRVLSDHISRQTNAKYLTTDDSIEKGEDEIAEIGRAFNRLVRHINGLIKAQKRMYEQKQQLEMNALQAQINPHFLYNTLDSVRWMAVIQKANGIADTVMSLENLLRNMAKGTGEKITLREELSLAQDYVKLQQVRYMEIFDYICDVPEAYMDYTIVKMTMQPIIENSILHGIVPTGTYGEIRVSIRETEKDLYISVEDNGTGIDGKEFRRLVKNRKNKNAMSGIGVTNVDDRLRMMYGREYGLSFEGETGRFARVTIHIPKEKISKEKGEGTDV